MKKNLIITYGVALHILLIVILIKPDIVSRIYLKLNLTTITKSHEYYMNNTWEFYKRRSNTIDSLSSQCIFFGNSIVSGLCVESQFSGINFGIAGENISRAKSKISAISNLSNKTIILAYGINDIPRNSEDILNDYKDFISKLPASSRVFISSILPINESILNKRINQKKTNKQIIELNELLKEYAKSDSRISYMNTAKYLYDEDGSLKDGLHMGDGIHLNKDGNHLWVKAIREELQR
ncbi:GDSL-type esterase/lipase family protein [Mangrovibacterium sp.]|uniref:GDSL-type esterase/lipase family protein n=1 Tax=Mangrovibacterium sp. TaxID=1961364 RepID=UPI00356AA659